MSEDCTLLVRFEELNTFILKQKLPTSLIDDIIAKNQEFQRDPVYCNQLNYLTKVTIYNVKHHNI